MAKYNKKPGKFKFSNADGVKYSLSIRNIKKKELIRLKLGDCEGFCETPDFKKPKIVIQAGLCDYRTVEILVEELTHAFFFEKSEREVRKLAKIMTRALNELGYLRIKD